MRLTRTLSLSPLLCICLFYGIWIEYVSSEVVIEADPCNAYNSTCSTCVSHSGCGYCPASQTCISGNSSGPSNGTCGTKNAGWQFGTCYNCSLETSCQGCSSHDELCGWCAYGQVCMEGGSSGPHGTNTCYLGWFYDTPCINCSAVNNCSNCVNQNYYCGWCESLQQCVEPVFDGTTPGYPNCTTSLLYFGGCPDCFQYSTCGSCSAASSSSGCGWCYSTESCVEGDSSGPYAKECSHWTYNTLCPDCTPYDSCYDCSFDSSCGWCVNRSVCVNGNSNGPWTEADCPAGDSFAYETATCPDPYPWTPSRGSDSNSPIFGGIEIAAIAIVALLILGVILITFYIIVLRVVHRQKISSYKRVEDAAASYIATYDN